MLYKNLHFPSVKNRPFFYTNFISTVDGKVQVVKDPYAYWPIGSKVDYKTLVELRAYADVLIHGKNTAAWFPHVDNLEKEDFKKLRKKLGKKEDIKYMVISNNPSNKLIENIKGKNSFLVTSEKTEIKKQWNNKINILKFGKESADLNFFSSYLYKNNFKTILVEGGPLLLASFLKQNLIDEVFLTIAPKILGNENGSTLTMVEGYLFPPEKIKKLHLLSIKKVKDEVFLRYRI